MATNDDKKNQEDGATSDESQGGVREFEHSNSTFSNEPPHFIKKAWEFLGILPGEGRSLQERNPANDQELKKRRGY